VILIFVIPIFSIPFTSSVSPTDVNASTTNQILNFTINNTNTTGNITHVNITLPSGFTFIDNSNTTTAIGTNFSNTTNVAIWVNTTAVGFVVNGTTDYFSINVTVPSVASAAYNFNVSTLDTSTVYNSTNVTVTVNDTTKPTYSNNSTNTTKAAQPCNFTLDWTDNVGLAGYIFSTNNSGTWQNASWVSFSGTTNTSWNVTALNSTKGTVVGWCFYANDTNGNINGTSCSNPFTLTTTDNPPTYSNNSTNTTIAGILTEFRLKWTDDIGLSGYNFSFDNCTGSLVNDTNWTSMTGLTNWSNVTKITNSTAGCTIRWKVYANDTYGNWNSTDIMNFTVGLTHGSSCTVNNQCLGGYCVHNECWSASTKCGDAYCDTGETSSNCPTDCGGGGGGDGGLTGTGIAKPYIKLAEGKVNITMSSLTTGGKMIATIARKKDVAIRQLNITVVNNVANIKIMITKLPSLPATVSYDIEGKVYHYINIEKINITGADINKTFIKFAVNKTWLTDNSVDTSNITFYRWADNGWNDLDATKVDEDEREIFYSAESLGLSVFVIGTKGGAPEILEELCTENWSCTEWSVCVNNTQTRTCTDANACGTTVNKPAESQSCEVAEAEVVGFPIWSTAVVIVVIIVVVYNFSQYQLHPRF